MHLVYTTVMARLFPFKWSPPAVHIINLEGLPSAHGVHDASLLERPYPTDLVVPRIPDMYRTRKEQG